MLVDAGFFSELDRFELMVKKRVSTAYAGIRRSTLYGRGLVAVGYREYAPGDDFKTIDWKVYGRTEKLYVKQFEEEKTLTAHILLDTSASMGFGNPRKFDYAARLALGIAYLITRENEKFAISTFQENIEITRPRRSRYHLSRIIEMLEALKPSGTTAFDRCMQQYQGMIRSKSLVVILSDFLTDIESITTGIYRYAKNELIVVQVLDAFELSLRAEGETKFIDLEEGTSLEVNISPRFVREYRARLEAHNSRIQKICDEIGASYHLFSTEKPIFDAFSEIMSKR
jgi:uncharacterized protein (DUF58 family)